MTEIEIDISEEIKRLEIAVKTLVTTKFSGNYRSVFKGIGLEFAGHREYTPEDDFRFIDWKASARTNALLVKEFVEERNLNVIFLIDTSAKMLFGSTQKIKSQYISELVAVLAYTIIKNNDNVSLIAYNDKSRNVLPLASGYKQFYKLARILLDKKNYSGSFNLGQALKYVYSAGKKESLLIIVSDFINPGKDWETVLKVVGNKFDVVTIMVRDPRDRELPPGYNIILQSPESSKKLIVNTSVIKDKYSNYVKQEEQSLRESFLLSKSDFLSIQTDKPFIEPLIALFRWRQKKWR